MRPIEKTVLSKIGEDGITLDKIEEIVDSTSRSELKKSYPDDSHFQTPRYFAKIIAESLVRQRLVRFEDGRYRKPEKKKEESKE